MLNLRVPVFGLLKYRAVARHIYKIIHDCHRGDFYNINGLLDDNHYVVNL